MKKAQKALILILACAFILSCASSGGGSAAVFEGTGIPAAGGNWYTYDDGDDPNNGSSTIEMAELEMDGMLARNFTGDVTTQYIYGFAGWGWQPMDPETEEVDQDALDLMKTMAGITFKIKCTQGLRYAVKYVTTDITDHAYYEYVFSTNANEVMTIEVPMRFFMQPSWGQFRRLNTDRVGEIQWQTHESWRPGNFDVTIWDVLIYPGS